MFYLAVPELPGIQIQWHQVITLKSGYSMKIVNFSNGSLLITEEYDLNGLMVYSISDSWAPYLIIEDCNKSGTKCKSSGYLIDYVDLMAEQYNFTYESHRQMDGDWGTLPKSGPYNMSGEWGGAMGRVVNREYEFCLSSWSWIRDRYDLLSFAIIISMKSVLLWSPKNPEIDFGLFIRPFTDDAWVAIFCMAAVVVVCILFTYRVLPNTEHTNGHLIIVTTLWYFFLLLHTFYGGALTMFFTTTVTIPHEGIIDVMRAYPDWKLMFNSGTDVLFALPAKYDSDYAKYWARVLSNPEETKY
jgi:hypothetical protein